MHDKDLISTHSFRVRFLFKKFYLCFPATIKTRRTRLRVRNSPAYTTFGEYFTIQRPSKEWFHISGYRPHVFYASRWLTEALISIVILSYKVVLQDTIMTGPDITRRLLFPNPSKIIPSQKIAEGKFQSYPP